jgi:capsule polysaccharide export protein KpsE/RkpR
VDRLTHTTLEDSNGQDLLLSPEEQEIAEESNAEPQFVALGRLIWPQRAFVAKASLIGLLVTAVLTLMMPNHYEATIQLMPPDSSSLSGSSALMGMAMNVLGSGSKGGGSSMGSSGGFGGAIGDLLGVQKPGALFIQVLSSRTISDHLIDRFDLRKLYGAKTYASARKKLLSMVDFKEDKKSGTISIAVHDWDKARATAMTQAYIDELNGLLSHLNNSAASREAEFLQGRLVTIHQELESAEKDLSQFSSKNATLDPEDQGKAMLDAASMLQSQLIAAKSELSGLEQIYTGDNVRVRSLRAHIAELEQQLNNFGGKDYSGSTKLDANALYPSLRQLPVLGQRYVELYRQVKVDEAVFELLTQAYEMARVEEAKDTPSIKVLDPPKLPEKKSWPPRTLLSIGGGFLGFCFASAWIVAGERWSEDEPYRMFFREVLRGTQEDFLRLRARIRKMSARRKEFSPEE